jgi:hypothetical protein
VRQSVMNCPDWVKVTVDAVVARKRSRENWQQWVNSKERLMVALILGAAVIKGRFLRWMIIIFFRPLGKILSYTIGYCFSQIIRLVKF